MKPLDSSGPSAGLDSLAEDIDQLKYDVGELKDLLSMQAGDVIPVEMPDHMVLCANGVPTFKSKLGAVKGNLALQILGPVARPR